MSDLSDLFAHIKLVIPSYLSQAWFEQTDKLHNSFINWSQVSNFHFFNQYFRWSKLPTMTPESQKTLITSCWDFTYQLWYWVQLSTSSCYAQFFPPKSYGLNQGNLLRGIDNKTVRVFQFVYIQYTCQSHYRKVPPWGVSTGARKNWKSDATMFFF